MFRMFRCCREDLVEARQVDLMRGGHLPRLLCAYDLDKDFGKPLSS